MTDFTPPRIEIDPSPKNDQIGAAVRSLLLAVGGFVVGKGWLDANIMSAFVGLIMVAWPAVWAFLKATHNKAVTVELARAAPDDMAIVKGDPTKAG